MKLNDVGVGKPIKFVEIAKTKIAISRVGPVGQGHTVVCLHAIGHGGRDFEQFVELNKHDFDIVCIDWPGQGNSVSDGSDAASDHYADLLENILGALEIERPILVGCSIGGAVAIRYASKNPVSALVLCNSGGLIPLSPVSKHFCLLMSRFFAAGVRGAWWYPSAFRLYYRLVLPSPNAHAQRLRIINRCQETAPVLQQAWKDFSTMNNDLSEIACQIDEPILIAWAMQDRVLPFALNRRVIKKLKNAVVRKFEGGHAAFLEQPNSFSREFREFASDLPSRCKA